MQFDPGLEYKPNRGEVAGAIEASTNGVSIGNNGAGHLQASSGPLVAHNNPNMGNSTNGGGNKDDNS